MAWPDDEQVLANATAPQGEDFVDSFTSKLQALNETQQSINTLSLWLRYHGKRSEQAAEIWAAEALKAPVARHLLFIYLLNDVLQTSRKKAPQLCQQLGMKMEQVLPRIVETATPQVRDKIGRVVNVWDERGVLLKPDVVRLRNILALGGGKPAMSTPAMPAAAAAALRSTGSEAASLSSCLESLQSSDVLDRTITSTQTDGNLAQVLLLKDGPVDDPSQLSIALGRADAAFEQVQGNNDALRAELEDRKRLIVLLCTAVEQQEVVCAEIAAAIKQGEGTLSRVVDTRSRLDNVRAQSRAARARARAAT
ncbi:hypothetical protein T492DRAFT_1093169 [Pavlovales sp. CCMP2436]|nr:hypothetical protein T492DRAFT_1093169 [Pavlovales sp. CCMP2436]